MGVSQERSFSDRTNSRQSRQEIIMICGKDFRYSGIFIKDEVGSVGDETKSYGSGCVTEGLVCLARKCGLPSVALENHSCGM